MNEAANKKDKHDSYQRDEVVQIINSVLEKVNGQKGGVENAVYRQLCELKDIIEQARAEISSAHPSEIKEKHIPSATDELDAVVSATAEATGIIMDCCEVIQQAVGETAPEVATAVEAEVTKIFEACSFQDITGQRITKVVKTLKIIDEKISMLLSVLTRKMPGLSKAAVAQNEEAPESLLNGPQLPDKAITQADIDKLLAEFDN